MHKGYLCLVLHAHLPFVRHPEYEDFLEEKWLFEAITESYIPLIRIFDNLLNEGIDFRITISLSPTLISMLEDELLQRRYLDHLDKLIHLSKKEIKRTQNDGPYNLLAHMYHRLFEEARYIYVNRYDRRLIYAFKRFQKAGVLEIITSSATHAYLPLLRVQPDAVRGQIFTAVDYYTQVFGQPPRGIWLPECGFYPGLDEILREAGIRYFFVDTHGVENASVRPNYGVYAPIACPSGVAAFGRDPESSKQVWSSKEGYPGDFDYREFYRDIGFDLDFDYVKPHIHDGHTRINTGIKYYRITGTSDHKEPYVPRWATEKAGQHAGNFLFYRQRQAECLSSHMDRKPIVVAPYDAELFGHWWFEGPQWLDLLIRKTVFDQDEIALITPFEYLREYPVLQTAIPSGSSWGYKGYNEFWLNGSNDWIYPHLHHCAERMADLVRNFRQNGNPLTERALNQAARSLLLAQSSDWAFIMKTGTAEEYAYSRIKDHLARFYYLEQAIRKSRIDKRKLLALETMDNIFPQISYRYFRQFEG
jgi:1,4-alpha-glucan branching enzyme